MISDSWSTSPHKFLEGESSIHKREDLLEKEFIEIDPRGKPSYVTELSVFHTFSGLGFILSKRTLYQVNENEMLR